MAYMFGSRLRGDYREDSDWDLFADDQEISLIPQELLICNGGPLDVFHMPDGGGWAVAVGEDRFLKVFDGPFLRIDTPLEIPIEHFLKLYLDMDI